MCETRRVSSLFIATACVLVASCGGDRQADSAVPEQVVQPTEGFVQVNGARLHYLDWGGTGDGLVFLHGLGDSPHAFDEIAPAFRDRFRVVSYARRAHGRSSGSAGPFDNATLVEDLRGLLDSLGIARAALVGWSLGGNEISEFAVRHHDRVLGLVYLDCYDLSDPDFPAVLEAYPVDFTPDSSVLESMEAFRAWWKDMAAPNVAWSPAMEAQVADLVEVRPDGSLHLRPAESVMGEFFVGAMAYGPDYGAIQAPMLAFFAEQDADGVLPRGSADALRQKVRSWFEDHYNPWQEEGIRRFTESAPHAKVVFLPQTSHSALPFEARDTIVTEVRRFLAVISS